LGQADERGERANRRRHEPLMVFSHPPEPVASGTDAGMLATGLHAGTMFKRSRGCLHSGLLCAPPTAISRQPNAAARLVRVLIVALHARVCGGGCYGRPL